ncbi:zona pellucida sperm-binding protein 1-like [Rhinoderma darwinii]|uniref:zona pellucida sperm-binding protein 1-like n=1 Tax=Rhinoderma darwinii TaxID=43563 RepID=UPI003F679B46
MVALNFLDGLWMLVFSMWPLLGSCGNSAGVDYRCGEEGVQVQVSPLYLGEEVSFQVRDEFGMGYDLQGCLAKCLLSTRGPKGEGIFYSPYTVCLSVLKEGTWLLRVRLVGHTKSEDLDLICPKPKKIIPRGMHHTPRPRSTKRTTLTTGHPWKPTQYETGSPTRTRFPLEKPTIKPDPRTTTSGAHGGKVTPRPTVDFKIKVVGTAKDVVSRPYHQTQESPQEVSTPRSTDIVPATKPSDLLTPAQCRVPTGRISCLNTTVSRDTCLDYRCCRDPTDPNNSCYYGHTVTVHCLPDGLFRLILSRYITSPPLQLSSVVLGPGACPSPTILGDFLEFNGQLSSCSARRFLQGRLVYELSLTARPDVLVSSLGSITRDSSLTVVTRCLSNTLSKVSLVVLAPEPPSVISTGVLSVELRISKGSSFSSFYDSEDFPVQILLRDLVFLEARLLQPSDPRLHLRLHSCWGAPSMDTASTLRWPVIHDGAINEAAGGSWNVAIRAFRKRSNVKTQYTGLLVLIQNMIQGSGRSPVYFFCSVSVCLPSPSESCTSDCANLTRSRRAHTDGSMYLVGTSGPLVFQQEKELGLARLQDLTSTLPGIVFAVTFLLIVLLLAGALKLKNGFTMLKHEEYGGGLYLVMLLQRFKGMLQV